MPIRRRYDNRLCIISNTPTLPTVTDNCGNTLTPSGPAMSGTYSSCEGTIIYTYTYTDCEVNTHNWVYTYTVERLDFTDARQRKF